MAKRFDLIVFDWDGTLMDSAAAIVNAIMAATRDLDLPLPSEARARHVIGLGLSDALRHAVPDLPESDYPRMVERYRYHYLAGDHELSLFPGTYAMIEELSAAGRMLAVATGKSRLGLNRALEQSGLTPFFHSTRCADECFSKPHPAMLEEIMDELGVARDRTLMVGDTTHDLQMARNAGVAGLGVAFGAHPREALEAEEVVGLLDSPAELALWLRDNA
ncbi:HAD-IA family hydrolase [Aromatoleum evansii]|uniref:HAD-IA family hydrolase n=1 Tax=Aromatoleum evansii TaxID=59406 RepID=A0ABZ1AS39_AROEV|nr:HAD-IA family hydrolase [Aromatoleum evansii]NMG31465.1 HAD-IA family hydrolase [Aromatoleum evansii]WRL47811.1 HAD-IA family hydrolase [Aromatoleum evansii]